MNIYETFLLDGDKTNFETNLKFIYGEENISYEEGFIIYFNGSWNPTDRDNHKYKAVINLKESEVNVEVDDDDYDLIKVECQVSFNDSRDSKLLEKLAVPTYVVRGGTDD